MRYVLLLALLVAAPIIAMSILTQFSVTYAVAVAATLAVILAAAVVREIQTIRFKWRPLAYVAFGIATLAVACVVLIVLVVAGPGGANVEQLGLLLLPDEEHSGQGQDKAKARGLSYD